MIEILPIHLVILRAIFALTIIVLAQKEKPSKLFIWCFIFGFSTDFLDGVIARHYHTGSVLVNILDGVADVSLYTASLIYLKKFYMTIIKPYYTPLKLLVIFQLIAWLICFIKFGHISSWHTYMAKVFGLTIVASVGLIAILRKSIFLPLLLIIGTIYLADDIAITIVMPYWRTGVMSVFHALDYKNRHD